MAEEFDISLDWFLLNRGPQHFLKERERVKALEQALQKAEEELKALEEKGKQLETTDAAGIQNRPEIKELLEHMEREPLLYHEILAHLHRFLKTPITGDKSYK
jgi:hypothetical protein